MSDLLEDFAEQVRERLALLVELDGRTQREIAERAGMSPAHLNQVLGGHRKKPSISSIGAILAAIGKSWRHLDGPDPRKDG